MQEVLAGVREDLALGDKCQKQILESSLNVWCMEHEFLIENTDFPCLCLHTYCENPYFLLNKWRTQLGGDGTHL